MEIFALLLLIIFSLIGFALIFFTTFGTLFIVIGALLYAIMTEFSIVSLQTLVIIVTLYFVGEVMEYVCIILGAKKLGASNAAVVGALIGGILGGIMGGVSTGVGLIPGVFCGLFGGAFLVEYLIQRDLVASLKAGLGTMLGRIGSIAFKLVIAVVMFVVLCLSIMAHSSFVN